MTEALAAGCRTTNAGQQICIGEQEIRFIFKNLFLFVLKLLAHEYEIKITIIHKITNNFSLCTKNEKIYKANTRKNNKQKCETKYQPVNTTVLMKRLSKCDLL